MKNLWVFLLCAFFNPFITSARQSLNKDAISSSDSNIVSATLINIREVKAFTIKYTEKHHLKGKYNCDTFKKVLVVFTVLATGIIDTSTVHVINNKEEWVNETFKQEAIRFVKEANTYWRPATRFGKPVADDCSIVVHCFFFR